MSERGRAEEETREEPVGKMKIRIYQQPVPRSFKSVREWTGVTHQNHPTKPERILK